MSAAVSIKPPIYCYPVGDLESESPIGWTYSMHTTQHMNSNVNNPINSMHFSEGDISQHTDALINTGVGVGTGVRAGVNLGASVGVAANSLVPPRLRDCILLQPGSTVGDVYDALKRGAIPHVTVHGDFVRAEAKGLDIGADTTGIGGGSKKTFKKRQIGRDVEIDETCCVIRIQTNRKALWQQSSITATEAAASAASVLR